MNLKFVTLGLLAVSAAAVPATVSAADYVPEIYGNVLNFGGSVEQAGIYKFSAVDGTELTPVKVSSEIGGLNGSVYADGKYHTMSMFKYRQFDATTWDNLKEVAGGFMTTGKQQTIASVYDAVDGKIYGYCLNYMTQTYDFGPIDYVDFTPTTIGSISSNDMSNKVNAMLATKEGQLYCIQANNTLSSIDKATGTLTAIGSTEVNGTAQCAVTDPNTDKSYVVYSSNEGTSVLYELDLTDASVTFVATLAGSPVLTGLYILPVQGETPAEPNPAPQVEIYANLLGTDSSSLAKGIYKFNPTADLNITPVKLSDQIGGNNGSTYVDGKYYTMSMFNLREFDATTWDLLSEGGSFMTTASLQHLSAVYDKTDGKVYGCYMSYSTYSYNFGVMDFANKTVTSIADLGQERILHMVATPEGKIFGVKENGILYEFDKTTGAATEIGNTELGISTYVQGSVCDPNTGKVYMAACLQAGGSGLYELDLTDASATLIAQFPDGAEFTGLYILPGQGETPVEPEPVAEVEIFANLLGSDSGTAAKGIYKFNPTAELNMTPVKLSDQIGGNNGSTYVDGKYYTMSMFNLREFDATTWDLLSEGGSFMTTATLQHLSAVYDKTDGKVYGCYMSYSTYSYNFGVMDFANKTVTSIADLGQERILHMVATPEGKIFGVKENGILYEFDKTTGAATEIGNTELGISTYVQGSVCDPNTGKVYMAACLQAGGSGLYELDLTDASATLIAQFPDGEEFTGLYILPGNGGTPGNPDLPADAAPAQVTDVTLNFAEGSTEGTVSFAMPTVDKQGGKLNHEVKYAVTFNGTEMLTGAAMPGTAVTTDSLAVEPGMYTVIVTTSNDAGNGPSASVHSYIGFDIPQTPANVVLVNEGSNMTVTWNAVTASKNNGWFDAANVKYNVVRQPEAVKVAEGIADTTYTDVLENAELRGYWYEVTAVNGTAVSEAGASNTVTSGTYVVPPYFEDFKRENSLALFTVEDANADGKTWGLDSWSPIAEYVSGELPGDDWLITPPVKLSAGEFYSFSFKTLTFSDSETHIVSAAMGSANNGEAMTEVLIPATEQSGNETHSNEAVVSVAEDGIYYFGIHVGSRPNQNMLQLTDLSIKSIASKEAPAAPELTVAAGAKGALSASYTVKVDGLNGYGMPVEAVSKIEVARDGQVISTIENPVVGTVYTGEDSEVAEGMHRYSAIAYAADKNGLEGVVSVFVGEDAPLAPANIRTEVQDNAIVVSWDAATVGQHGGYVNPEKVTYTLVTSNEVAIVKDYKETTYTDTPEMGGPQHLMGYGVFASNDKGKSQITLSAPVLIGDPYPLPYVESFARGEVSSFIGIASNGNAGFQTSTDTSCDGDGGSVMFTSFEPESEGTFYTGKISMAGATNPTLQFQVATVNSFNEMLYVDVLPASGQKKTVAAYDISKIQTGVWCNGEVNLSEYKNESYIQLYFRVHNLSESAASLYMDRISVSNTSSLGSVGLDQVSQDIFDLSGRHLGTDRSVLAPGIYIIGGSKVVIK